VLGYEYAARAYEAASASDKAVAARERALATWDNTLPRYTSHVMRRRVSDGPFLLVDIGEVKKETVTSRVTELKRSLSVPGGAALERGRWLLSTARHEEAIAQLERVLREYPESATGREAHYLVRRARLERALHLGDMEEGGRDRDAAMKEREALGREPQDFAIMAAQIARASLLWLQGDPSPVDDVNVGSVLGKRVVGITVQPPLAAFGGCDHRMRGFARVLARVPVRRRITAARRPARLAGAQVDPGGSNLDALLAFAARGLAHVRDRLDMRAAPFVHSVPPAPESADV
jgi:tetratricopeptide (TPR) repeat protein